MTRVDEINAQIAKLEAERANVLAKMKADIKLYGFKTTDFKGVLLTRAKRGAGTAAKERRCQTAGFHRRKLLFFERHKALGNYSFE